MKRMLTMALLAVTVTAAAAQAEAKSLEEILKDKGVITEEDYRAAIKNNDLAYYKPGRGITVESRDGKYTAHIGGRLQSRYTFLSADQGEDESTFTIRRMKLWLQGNVFSKNLSYKYQQNLNETEDAYLAYKFAEAFALQIGQAKAPQGRQELTSSGSQLFVDRSLANDTFNLGRDIGLTAEGQFMDHLVEYMAGIYNGNGPNQGNPNTEHMLAARLDVNPLGAFKMDEAGWPETKPLLNMGASYAMQTMKSEDMGEIDNDNDLLDKALDIDGTSAANFTAAFGNELDWSLWTANLHAKWMGASFGAEYYALNAEPAVGADWDADGYYVQAGYQILPQTLELALRYSKIDSTDVNAFEKFDRSEVQAGINYYFSKHNAKIQADYTTVSDDLATGNDDNILRVQAQLIF
ncbi:MAG: porin [Trichloromonadaceae bacterium]